MTMTLSGMTTHTGTMEPEHVRCAGCGIRGQWVNGIVINPGPQTVPALCVTVKPIRAHGPWIPDTTPVTLQPGDTHA